MKSPTERLQQLARAAQHVGFIMLPELAPVPLVIAKYPGTSIEAHLVWLDDQLTPLAELWCKDMPWQSTPIARPTMEGADWPAQWGRYIRQVIHDSRTTVHFAPPITPASPWGLYGHQDNK